MAQVSFGSRQVSCKIVYYGPGLSGKTTNLEMVYQKVPAQHRGELTSIATEGDRTLFFDFMPLDLGNVSGMQTKFQLYTVPGQVYYNATRKLVLQGADGIVFVADSAPDRLEANLESMANLEGNLAAQGVRIEDVPLVIQYNKRDLPNAVSVALLESRLNSRRVPSFEAVASGGDGVLATLKILSKLVLDRLNERYGARSIAASGLSARISEVSLRPAAAAVTAGGAAAGAPAWEPVSRPVTIPPGPPASAVAVTPRRSADASRPSASMRIQPRRGPVLHPAARTVTLTSRHQKRAESDNARLVAILIGMLIASAALGAALWFFG